MMQAAAKKAQTSEDDRKVRAERFDGFMVLTCFFKEKGGTGKKGMQLAAM